MPTIAVPTRTAPSLASVMATLRSKGKENTRKLYAKHGMDAARVLGVSVAELKAIAKTIKRQQELACEFYATGIMEAMYLAGMVADGSKLTAAQLNEWAEGAAGLQMISEYTVAWVAVENAKGRELALKWMKSKNEAVAASGWCTYSGLVATMPDEKLDLREIEGLLATVKKEIQGAPNRVRYTMNNFVISVGTYAKPLFKLAKSTASQIGDVSVDVGETACKVPVASDSIAKVEGMGRVGLKKKTIRC